MSEVGEDSLERSALKRGAFWGGIAAALLLFLFTRIAGLPLTQCFTAGVAGICAVWWIAQPVPIPVTSIIPFAVLPVTGVLDEKETAASFGHPMVMLLMGGFMLSTAVEASGAHRRLALGMTRLVSGRGAVAPQRLLLGFMLAAAFASMWISNTATTLILLPIAIAAAEGEENAGLRMRLLVGVAYASSIGGIGTPIGTPPNLLFMAEYQKLGNEAWSFFEWMKIGIPVVLGLLPLAYFRLAAGMPKKSLAPLVSLPPMSTRERRVLLVFAMTALLWMTRLEPWGGWSRLLDASAAGDATVAFIGLTFMLLLPDGSGRRLLTWKEAENIPWGILLLFGGGIALAAGFKESSLSASLGSGLSVLTRAPEPLVILGICLSVTFLTEVTSNTATTALLMPILAATALSAGIAPERLMIPAALSASCAFMLPVATAPNAIIFGSRQVSAPFMARQGFILNILGAFLITGICVLLL